MHTLSEILRLSTRYLEEHRVRRPRLSAEFLLAHCLRMKRLDLYLQFDRPLEEAELQMFRALLKKRGQGTPVEYLIGEVLFYGCVLQVTGDVLIPRPETEILLDKACQIIQAERKEQQSALDLCTGSGCLAIGLKKRFPFLEVVATDVSENALHIAKSNAQNNQIALAFRQGDLLDPVTDMKFHYVLCNPPYLAEAEYEQIDREVRQFEPKVALVGGGSGLEFFERLCSQLPKHLEEGAWLFFEIGASQGDDVMKIFDLQCWKNKRVEPDFAGHPRFFFCQYFST
jgi:release factor glutamine methyltransferase